MEFPDATPFTNFRPIRQVNGFSSIVYETYLKQTMRSVGNRFHAPDFLGKPLPKSPETQKATRFPSSCLKCQLPSDAYRALLSMRFVYSLRFSLFSYF